MRPKSWFLNCIIVKDLGGERERDSKEPFIYSKKQRGLPFSIHTAEPEGYC